MAKGLRIDAHLGKKKRLEINKVKIEKLVVLKKKKENRKLLDTPPCFSEYSEKYRAHLVILKKHHILKFYCAR